MRKLVSMMFALIMVLLPSVASARRYAENLANYARSCASDNDSCWFVGVFKTLFEIINDIIVTVCGDMEHTFLGLLGIGLAFWLLFRVGRAIFDISSQADTALVPDVLKKVIQGMMAAT